MSLATTISPGRRWVSFVILSMTGGIIFQVAYIRFVFLEGTYTALQLTAQEYGNIMSIFGTLAVIMYFVGGWLADTFSPKLLIVVALVGTGVADLYLTTVPGYTGTLVAHIVMAVMGMGLYWSALVKAIGMLGAAGEQGRLFGFLEGTRGLTSTIVGFIGAAIVAAAVVPAAGVLELIRLYGILCFVFAALVFVFVRENSAALATVEKTTVGMRQLWVAATNTYTWLIGGTIALMYCFYTTLGYFTPLLQHGFGMAAGLIGVIGVIRTYVFMFVAGPVGGIVVDKVTRSSPRFLGWMFLACGIIAALFLVLPTSPDLIWLAVALMFVLSFAIFAARGVYWAQVGELDISPSQRGGVIGLASGLAYLPDAFLPALSAYWIGDTAQGVPEQGGGYGALFTFLIVAAALGFLLTTLTTRLRARDLARLTAPATAGAPSAA